MLRRFVSAALAIAALNAIVAVHAADDDICSVEISKCYIDGGSKSCNREKAVCPPCLAVMDGGAFGFLKSTKYACYQLDDNSDCPEDTTSCSATPSPTPTPTPKTTPKKTPSSSGSDDDDESGSGSSSTTPKPTTKKPSKTKASSSSSSGSSSNSTSVKTPKPTPSPTPKPTPTPTPTPTETASPQVTQSASPSNATASTDDDSSSSSLGLILAIVGGCAVAVAVLGFFIWKRRQDDDDDSDDDEPRFPPPKSNYNQSATSTAYAVGAATTFSKPNNPGYQGDMQTSPVRAPSAQTYAVPVAAPVVNYSNNAPAGGAGYRLSDPDSLSSSEGGRDVWGNAVGSYREKRTHSNVSVEF